MTNKPLADGPEQKKGTLFLMPAPKSLQEQIQEYGAPKWAWPKDTELEMIPVKLVLALIDTHRNKEADFKEEASQLQHKLIQLRERNRKEADERKRLADDLKEARLHINLHRKYIDADKNAHLDNDIKQALIKLDRSIAALEAQNSSGGGQSRRMSASFRIRRVYFDQIKAGIKTNEIRQDKPYWRKVASRYPTIAVFVCGKEVHRRAITSITVGAKAEEVLGRPLSAQGIKDIGTGSHVVFYLGEEIEKHTDESVEGEK